MKYVRAGDVPWSYLDEKPWAYFFSTSEGRVFHSPRSTPFVTLTTTPSCRYAANITALGILQLSTIGRSLMSTQAQVDAVVDQLVKARGEIVAAKNQLVAKIVDLQNQLDAGVPAEYVDLSALKAVAQSLDDIDYRRGSPGRFSLPDVIEEPVEEDDDEVVL